MTCEYKRCRHKGDQNCNEYDGHWYHDDCYAEMQDVRLMLSIWQDRINIKVNYGDFYKNIYSLLSSHSSSYILFCLEYALNNNKGLNYPAGLKYYVNKQEFVSAYEAEQKRKTHEKAKKYKFEAKEPQKEIEQTFTPQVDKGFSAIFGN